MATLLGEVSVFSILHTLYIYGETNSASLSGASRRADDIGARCIFWSPCHILQHSAVKHSIIGPLRRLML